MAEIESKNAEKMYGTVESRNSKLPNSKKSLISKREIMLVRITLYNKSHSE